MSSSQRYPKAFLLSTLSLVDWNQHPKSRSWPMQKGHAEPRSPTRLWSQNHALPLEEIHARWWLQIQSATPNEKRVRTRHRCGEGGRPVQREVPVTLPSHQTLAPLGKEPRWKPRRDIRDGAESHPRRKDGQLSKHVNIIRKATNPECGHLPPPKVIFTMSLVTRGFPDSDSLSRCHGTYDDLPPPLVCTSLDEHHGGSRGAAQRHQLAKSAKSPWVFGQTGAWRPKQMNTCRRWPQLSDNSQKASQSTIREYREMSVPNPHFSTDPWIRSSRANAISESSQRLLRNRWRFPPVNFVACHTWKRPLTTNLPPTVHGLRNHEIWDFSAGDNCVITVGEANQTQTSDSTGIFEVPGTSWNNWDHPDKRTVTKQNRDKLQDDYDPKTQRHRKLESLIFFRASTSLEQGAVAGGVESPKTNRTGRYPTQERADTSSHFTHSNCAQWCRSDMRFIMDVVSSEVTGGATQTGKNTWPRFVT